MTSMFLKNGRPFRTTEAKRARAAVGRALKRGELRRQACQACGKRPAHAHHDDYSKPLEVRWFCAEHHIEYHSMDPRLDPTRVLRARVESGMSQLELAAAVGCSTRTLQYWESGTPTRPHPRLVRSLAEVTKREPAWFYGVDGEVAA